MKRVHGDMTKRGVTDGQHKDSLSLVLLFFGITSVPTCCWLADIHRLSDPCSVLTFVVWSNVHDTLRRCDYSKIRHWNYVLQPIGDKRHHVISHTHTQRLAAPEVEGKGRKTLENKGDMAPSQRSWMPVSRWPSQLHRIPPVSTQSQKTAELAWKNTWKDKKKWERIYYQCHIPGVFPGLLSLPTHYQRKL